MTYERCPGSKGYSWNDQHEAELGAQDKLCQACRKAMHDAEAADPKEQRVWQLYAMKRGERFEHFYPSTMQLTMCGSDPYFLVELRLDPEGIHWGWYESHHPHNRWSRGHVSMIYPHRMAVEICFPYGPEIETKMGHGEIVRLGVKAIRPAVHPEGIRYDEEGKPR
jgi:hypothetical protein